MADVTRRTFLAAAVAGPLLAAGPLTVTVDDAAVTVAARPGATLLDVLRHPMGAMGPRSCEDGGCGACTVLLDGRPVLACLVLAQEAGGRTVTTARALVDGGRLDPVARACVESGAGQPEAALALRSAVEDGVPADAAELEAALGGVTPADPEGLRRAVARLSKKGP